MPEFFIVANSFAASFVSDQSEHYIESGSAENALEKLATDYKHPAGMYSAACYESHKSYLWRETPIAQWLCNHERERQKLTVGRAGYSYLGHGPGDFEIDGVRHTVTDPKGGSVVSG